MIGDIHVKSYKKTNKLTVLINQNGDDIEILEPLDYYGEPLFVVNKDNNGGYKITGIKKKVTSAKEIGYYKKRLERKFYLPLRWQING